VRAARALTDRDTILVCGYHGWHDWYIGSTTRNLGVPRAVSDLTVPVNFGDLRALQRELDRLSVAAVVLEPSGATVPAPGYLQAVVDATHRSGALVIFDEVITGFRLAPGGARERYGVLPDFSCYGKALGNGMPISAVAGGWDVMRVFEEVFFSGTHGGETLSLAAAGVVLDRIAKGDVLPAIHELGEQMLRGVAALIDSHAVGDVVHVGGEPERAVVGFSGAEPLVLKSWVQQCLIERGVLFNGSMFISVRHSEDDVQRALAGFDEAFQALACGDVASLLKGPPVQPVFRNL
jgi:glutamate-1-semialdehyde aminotransferase